MKVKRVKRAAKVLTFYRHYYKIVPPYQVLVDGTFCMAALINKLNLREQIAKYFGEETHIVTTECVLKELEQLGSDVYGALAVCRNFDVVHCPHMPFKGANDCFHRLAKKTRGKGTKFFFATQDPQLSQKIRAIPGAPILYIHGNTIILEKQSEVSIKESKGIDPEMEKLTELKKTVLGEVEQIERKPRKKKGVNPLSCKKKKLKTVTIPRITIGAVDPHRRRKRKRLAEHETPRALIRAADGMPYLPQ